MYFIILRFSVHVALYIISSLFLTVTICVYTYHPKLLNDYTRLMRQYALQLTLAFLLMAVNKTIHFGTCDGTFCGIGACKLNGNENT